MKDTNFVNGFVRAWWIYLLAGLLATGSYFLLPDARVQDVFYDLTGAVSVGAVVAGIRMNRPDRPLPWQLFAVGLSLLVAGDLLWNLYQAVAWSSLPFPPVACIPYLLGYLTVATGLLLLSWNRSGGWISFIDPAIIATGVGLVSWVSLLEPYAKDLSLPFFKPVLIISYLLMDLLLFAAMARLLMVSEERLPAYLLLALGTTFSLLAYLSSAPGVLAGTYTPGGPADAGWLLFYVLFGAAALHPSMAATAQTPREREEKLMWWRFVLLAGASLMVPAALVVEAAIRVPVSATVIGGGTVVMFGLVLARLAGTMRLRERALRRERVLRKFDEALVAAHDRESIHRTLLETVMDLASSVPGIRASLAAGSAEQMVVVATGGTNLRALQGLRIVVDDLPQTVRQALLAGEFAELRGFDPALFWKVLGDFAKDNNVRRRQSAIVAFLVMPLYVRGGLEGMIALCADAPFPASVRENLEALSVSASLALESAALSDERHQQRSEAWFGSLVRNASGVIMILDAGGTIRYASPSCKPILDYEPEDLAGIQALALVHPEDKLRVRTHFAGISGGPGVRVALEFRIRHADGSWRYVESVANNLLDDPNLQGVVINCRDVTERKKSQEALEEAELRYRTLVERMPAVTYTNPLDETDNSLYISPGVEDMLGYSVEEGEEDPELWDRLLHPEDRERVLAEEARTSATGDPFRMEYRMISRGGRTVWVRDESVLVRDDEGRPRFWQGIMLDITGRKNAEQALRYRFGFEKIIADTSTKFVDLAPEEVDSGIEDALRDIGKFSGADRSYVFLFSEDGKTTENTHEWCAEGIEPQIENLKDISIDTWPLAMRKFRNGEVHHVPRLTDLPAEAVAEREECEAQDIQSFVQIPMLREGTLVGFVGFDSVRSERVWSEDEIMLLKTVGELFTNALERRRVQRVLQEAEERYRSLVENIPAVTYVHPSGDSAALSYISPQIESILGYTAEEYISEPGFWMDRLHPDDKKRVLEEDKRTDETLEPYSIEYRMLSRDGRYVWVREEAVVVRDEENKPRYWQGFLWDITDRKEMEEAIREAEDRYRTLVEQIPAAIYLQDVEHNSPIQYISPQIENMTGYTPEEYTSRPNLFRSTMHPGDLESVMSEGERATRTGEPHSVEYRTICRDGHEVWVRDEAVLVRDARGRPKFWQGVMLDITAQKDLESRLAHQAFHDELTGLPNRALFMDRLKQALARTERRESSLAILFVDVDNFKFVNDSFGHEAGDTLLIEIARRVEKCIRPEDTAARLGGDEFTVLLEDLGDRVDATQVARRILEELQIPFYLEGTRVNSTGSIGIALGGPGHRWPSDLLRAADTALYRAKARGKNGYAISDEIMNQRAEHNLKLESELLRAVERGEMETHYQPKLELATGRVVGWEALVRWQHPLRGLVPPLDFIPIAEETGQIIPIGSHVLRQACLQLRDWRDRMSRDPDWTMSVNLSARQFQRPEIVGEVAVILNESGLEPTSLILEITESAAMEGPESSIHTLRKLKELGVKIAIDDFGTGYASLSRLRSFPVDILKVDKSFVDGLGRNTEDTAIVNTVIRLAHALNLKTVAEGVETAEQADTLRALGCEMGQGYYFARPLPANEINYPFDFEASIRR